MSHENVEVVRRVYEHFRATGDSLGDLSGFVAADFEFAPTRELDAGASYRGLEGFRRFLESFFGEFDDVRAEPHEFIDAGDRVFVALTFHARGKRSGAAVAWSVFAAWTVQDGMLTCLQMFTDRAEALEVVRLSG